MLRRLGAAAARRSGRHAATACLGSQTVARVCMGAAPVHARTECRSSLAGLMLSRACMVVAGATGRVGSAVFEQCISVCADDSVGACTSQALRMGLYIHASHGASCVRVCTYAAPGAAPMRLQGLASRLQTVVLRHSASPCTPTPPNLFVPSWLCVSQVLLCGGVRGVCPASQWARSCMQASIVAGALAWLVSSGAAIEVGRLLPLEGLHAPASSCTAGLHVQRITAARMGKARAPASVPPMTHLTKA